jgi:GT2 family glycosyltransferase
MQRGIGSLAGRVRGGLVDLVKRARLTVRYLGWRTFLFRLLTFPLRPTPIGRMLRLTRESRSHHFVARKAYRRGWRPVTIAIPTYGPPDETIAAVESLRRTTDRDKVRIVVADDASPAEHRERLRTLEGIELVLGEENAGFAANANRALRAAPADHDVVLLNSDVTAEPGWIESLQYTAYGAEDIGMVGPKLVYPDGSIQSAGSHRNLGAPEWFDHRYRFRGADHGPANVVASVLAMTGACVYVKRSTIDRIGLLDESYPMAYEDVDWCLRSWQAGLRVIYQPHAALVHHEAKTRGTDQGEREIRSQRLFWERWGDFFDRRDVREPDGSLRIVYVTEDTGVGGGHRVVFEHLNGLAARGHRCELYTLADPPDWFDLIVPVRTFEDYDELVEELAPKRAIKVATWWNTAAPVWHASVLEGIPVYFVQDIESSYYPGQPAAQAGVLSSYRQEFHYLTTSGWVGERLREMGLDPSVVAPGVNLETFRELGIPRRDDVLLSVGRTQPLKNLDLTIEAWRGMGDGRPELWLFGVEPEVGERHGARYYTAPADGEVNRLLNEATALVQTSRHEGFCLPLLEAMAAGAAVVCTDAHGNRDFCRDGENCLMPDPDPDAVRGALERVIGDPELRARLAEGGRRTAAAYDWEGRVVELERFFEGVAPAVELAR